jgi:dTDP-4-amino-4,6-dideoxy-D-galactose acyltransferase
MAPDRQGDHHGVTAPLRPSRPLRSNDLAALLAAHFPAGSELSRTLEREQARPLLAHDTTNDTFEVCCRAASGVCEGVLVAEAKAWESRFFGCPVYQISLFVAPSTPKARCETAASLLQEWIGRLPRGERAYLVVRTAAEDVSLVHALEKEAFSLLVPMVTLERDAAGPPAVEHAVDVGPVRPEEVDALTAIARDAFRYGRFWIEPRLPQEIAGDMHADWARNCCITALADEVLVLRSANGVAGFIAMRSRSYGDLGVDEINLIAVDASHRGKGAGRILVEAGRRWSAERHGVVVVRTELPNTQAVRLYEACGFRLGNGSLYFRRWVDPDDRIA